MHIRDLGEPGRAYTEQQLRIAPDVRSWDRPGGTPDPRHTPLSSIALYLQKIRLLTGHTWLFAPDGVPEENLFNFDDGWLNTRSYDRQHGTIERYEEGWSGERYVMEFIASYLAQGSDRHLVFQDPNCVPGDPILSAPSAGPHFYCGYHVYPFASGPQPTDQEVTAALSTGYPVTVGVLCQAAVTLPNRGWLDVDTLKQLAVGTDHILVGAYDMETYIVWSRSSAT
jgi:hypothetical protein